MPGKMQSTLKRLLGAASSPTLRFPRVDDVARSNHKHEIERVYRALRGKLTSIPLNLRAWDIEFEGIAVELDEYLHFNRYRAITLESASYKELTHFPLNNYCRFCKEREERCLRAGGYVGKWSNEGSEAQFGDASSPKDLSGNGAPRWKQRAFYDFIKDLSPLLIDVPVVRVAVWDTIVVDGRSKTVEEILTTMLRQPDLTSVREAASNALKALVRERAHGHDDIRIRTEKALKLQHDAKPRYVGPAWDREEGSMDAIGRFVADAVLGTDTLWGGDVMCASGTGRFIADSWFSDEPLPAAYHAPAAARVRASGGVADKKVDRQAVEEYLREVDIPQAIAGVRDEARKIGGLRGQYLAGLALCLEVMWDLAMEVLGKGAPVPYVRSVEASTGRPPEASRPEAKRDRVAELLGRVGLPDRRFRRPTGCGGRVAAGSVGSDGFGPRLGRRLDCLL